MSIFEFDDYKTYLKEVLPTSGDRRGLRARLAKVLKCQSGFVSQVLRGKVHFSLEQIAKIDEFLGHSVDEREFFILLAHAARAGSHQLRSIYQDQIKRILVRRARIDTRIDTKVEMNDLVANHYYSSWIYAAVHILCMIPKFQTLNTLSAALGISAKVVEEALENLSKWGLVNLQAGKLSSNPARWHLNREMPAFGLHHSNWRLQAIRALERRDGQALHYSGPMAISATSAERIHRVLIDTIAGLEPLITAPGEEVGRVICIDYFSLGE